MSAEFWIVLLLLFVGANAAPRVTVDVVVLAGYPMAVFLAVRLKQLRRRALDANAKAFAARCRPPEENIRAGDVAGVLLVLAGPLIATALLVAGVVP